MPIFESIPIINWSGKPVYINNPNDASLTAALGNQKGVCHDYDTSNNTITVSSFTNDKPGCRNSGFEWVPELVYNSNVYDRVINLDLISSFMVGKYTYDDPGGTFSTSDDNTNETVIDLHDGQRLHVNQAFNDFRSRMAKLF